MLWRASDRQAAVVVGLVLDPVARVLGAGGRMSWEQALGPPILNAEMARAWVHHLARDRNGIGLGWECLIPPIIALGIAVIALIWRPR